MAERNEAKKREAKLRVKNQNMRYMLFEASLRSAIICEIETINQLATLLNNPLQLFSEKFSFSVSRC